MRHDKRRPGPAAVVLLALAGCAGTGGNIDLRQRYVEPTGRPGASLRIITDAPADEVRERVLAGLEETPLEVSRVDPDGDFIVVRYSGDPEPFVDCGMFGVGRAGELGPAAAARRAIEADGRDLERMMRLDGRLVMTFEEENGQTAIDTDATYVLTKMVREQGSELWGAETVAFSSGRRGVFPKGTICLPTGAFEDAAREALSAAPVVAEEPPERKPAIVTAPLEEPAPPPPDPTIPAIVAPFGQAPVPAVEDLAALAVTAVPPGACGEVVAARTGSGRLVLAGVASDHFTRDSMVNAVQLGDSALQVDNRIRVVSEPACRAFQIARDLGGADADPLRLEIVDQTGGALQQGDLLQLALDVPADKRMLHLSYFRQDGTVAHLTLDAPDLPADQSWLIDTQEEIGPPYGNSLLLALATPNPLFAAPRPSIEDQDVFLAALEQTLGQRSDLDEVSIDCAILRTVEQADPGDPTPALPDQVCFRN